MKVKRIAFFGHRKIDNVNAVERMVEKELKKENLNEWSSM